MKAVRTRAVLLACAGLIVAGVCWMVSNELGLILPAAECGSSLKPSLIVTALLALAAFASAIVSSRAPWPGRTGQFTAHVSALFASVMLFALLLQVLATVLLTGCER